MLSSGVSGQVHTPFAGGIAFATAAAIVRRLSGHDPDLARLMAAPRDDEPLTEEERAAVEAAPAEVRAGHVIPFEDAFLDEAVS